MFKFLSKIFDTNIKELKRLELVVDKINKLEPEFKKLKKKDFSAKTSEFKVRLKKGESLDDLLPEAFALAREAIFWVSSMEFFVQAPIKKLETRSKIMNFFIL